VARSDNPYGHHRRYELLHSLSSEEQREIEAIERRKYRNAGDEERLQGLWEKAILRQVI